MFQDCYFEFSAEKNAILQKKRGIGFERIIVLIEMGEIISVKPHHNQHKYPNQHIVELVANGYIYLVPLVVDGKKIFLKTIYPSRKATKNYKKEE